jgi:hypothetical protein
MSLPLRSARPFLVALLAIDLAAGLYGLEGAIHSVHHLPASVAAHAHDLTDEGQGEHGGTPTSPTEEPCPIAAAASHAAAAVVDAPPSPAPASLGLEPVALRAPDAPRAESREPGAGRSPPAVRSLPG